MREVLPGAVSENVAFVAQQTLKRYGTLLIAAAVLMVSLVAAMWLLRGCDPVPRPPQADGHFDTARTNVTVDVKRSADTVRDTVTRVVTKYIPVATPSVLTESRAVLDTSIINADPTTGDTLRVPLHVEYQRDSNRFENIVLPAFTVRREREVITNTVDRIITIEVPKLVEVKDSDDWWWFGAGVATAVGGYFITREAIGQ